MLDNPKILPTHLTFGEVKWGAGMTRDRICKSCERISKWSANKRYAQPSNPRKEIPTKPTLHFLGFSTPRTEALPARHFSSTETSLFKSPFTFMLLLTVLTLHSSALWRLICTRTLQSHLIAFLNTSYLTEESHKQHYIYRPSLLPGHFISLPVPEY